MTTVNDDLIREFLAEEARRMVGAAPSVDEAVGRLAPRIEERPSGASQRLIILLAATLLLVVALGTAIAVGSGLVRLPALIDDPEFAGEWASTNYNDNIGTDDTYSQTMTVRAAEDGAFDITVHDDSSFECSDTPMTLTGAGRLEDSSTLVVPSPVIACIDGSNPALRGPSRLEEAGSSYTLVLDPATDRLYDNLGVVWNRGDPPEREESSTQEDVDERGSFSILHGEVTFRADPPWGDHPEAYIDPRLFYLVGPGHTPFAGAPPERAEMTIFVNPLAPEAACGSVRVAPSASELVEAIRSNPDLETSVPVTDPVGQIDALQMDVVAAPGGSFGPCGADEVDVVYVPGRPWGGIGPDDLGRVYVLDLPEGSARTLAILITAPDADVFQQALETAAPVLNSFEFHAP